MSRVLQTLGPPAKRITGICFFACSYFPPSFIRAHTKIGLVHDVWCFAAWRGPGGGGR